MKSTYLDTTEKVIRFPLNTKEAEFMESKSKVKEVPPRSKDSLTVEDIANLRALNSHGKRREPQLGSDISLHSSKMSKRYDRDLDSEHTMKEIKMKFYPENEEQSKPDIDQDDAGEQLSKQVEEKLNLE